jgi:hypothetical protein
MDLKAIQRHLRKRPFNKENVIKAIRLATSSWEKQYDVLYPDDLWKLDSVLKALAHRLEGTANPENYGEKEVAFADGEARPFLKKLDAAYTDVYNQLRPLEAREAARRIGVLTGPASKGRGGVYEAGRQG